MPLWIGRTSEMVSQATRHASHGSRGYGLSSVPLTTQQYRDYDYFKREEMHNLLEGEGLKYTLIEYLKDDNIKGFNMALYNIQKQAKNTSLSRVEHKYTTRMDTHI